MFVRGSVRIALPTSISYGPYTVGEQVFPELPGSLFTGNAVATVLIGTWVKEIDGEQVTKVLSGELPFDEQTMMAGHLDHMGSSSANPEVAARA